MNWCLSAQTVQLTHHCSHAKLAVGMFACTKIRTSAMAGFLNATTALINTPLFVTTAVSEALQSARAVVGVTVHHIVAMDMLFVQTDQMNRTNGLVVIIVMKRTVCPVQASQEIVQNSVTAGHHVLITGTKVCPIAIPWSLLKRKLLIPIIMLFQ